MEEQKIHVPVFYRRWPFGIYRQSKSGLMTQTSWLWAFSLTDMDNVKLFRAFGLPVFAQAGDVRALFGILWTCQKNK